MSPFGLLCHFLLRPNLITFPLLRHPGSARGRRPGLSSRFGWNWRRTIHLGLRQLLVRLMNEAIDTTVR